MVIQQNTHLTDLLGDNSGVSENNNQNYRNVRQSDA